MKNVSNAIFLVVSIFSMIALGCNRGDGRVAEKRGCLPFAFTEASQGLPSSGLWRQRLAFYDMNGDGHLDILAPPPRYTGPHYTGPVVWYGNGKGEWRESLPDVPDDTEYGYGGITASDFDGDGIPDIALAIHAAGLKALKGTGNGKYADLSDGLPRPGDFVSRALVTADFIGASKPCIVAVSEGKFGSASPEPRGILVCSRGEEGWRCEAASENKSLMSGLFADEIAAGDVNGDGRADLAVGSLAEEKNLIVWVNEGDGRFAPFNEGLPQEKIYLSVALEDLNGDGRDDLVANISGFGKEAYVGLKAFLSRESGFEDISEGLPVKEPYTVVAAGDMNNDGTVDIIGGTVAGGVKIFYQKDSRWEAADVIGLPTEGMRLIYGIYCVDLNGDGYRDIALNYASSQDDEAGGIRVFLNGAGEKKQTN